MEFRHYLKEQWKLHPATQPQDVIKHCYQAACGAEHLLTDIDKAKAYFYQEYHAVSGQPGLPLYEPISDDFCRVNLAAWKAENHDPEKLFTLFAASVCASEVTGTEAIAHAAHSTPDGSAKASSSSGSCEAVFLSYLSAAEALVLAKEAPFSEKEWYDFCSLYQKSGMLPVHHSEVYRLDEQPAYRLVRREFL